MYNYIFLKDKTTDDLNVELVAPLLKLEQYNFAGETNMCETGIVRDLYIGDISDGAIIFGDIITYNLIHDKEMRHNFLKAFDDCEIYAKMYDDRVGSEGFFLAKNGTFICARESADEEGAEDHTEGNSNQFIEETRANNYGLDESMFTYDINKKLEKKYLGQSLDDFDCQSVMLLKYKID